MVEARRIVVVLGMHRSGTSLCGNLLQAAGIDMAEAAGASPANARGHWERPRLNDLHDRIFTVFGRKWSDPSHNLALPDRWWTEPHVQAVRDEIIGWLAPLLTPGARFGFKDPRTARLLPMWHEIFERLEAEPAFVFCLRDPAQVARSVAARDRSGRDASEYRWLVYNADAVTGIGDRPICVIPYQDWFARPQQTLRRLTDFLGLGWSYGDPRLAELTADIVDADLRHDDAGMARPLPQRLYRSVLRCVPANRFSADLRAFCGALGEFQQSVQPMLLENHVLRVSVGEQGRVIGDLEELVRRMRREAEGLRAGVGAVIPAA